MAKIESGRWSEMLRRSLGMKGQELVASELSPEVSATWELERDSPEWGFLKGVRFCSVGVYQAESAGAVSNIRVSNPSGSGVLVIVDEIQIATTALAELHLVSAPTINQGALASSKSSGTVDGRWNLQETTAIVTGGNTALTGSWTLWDTITTANAIRIFNHQIIMKPDSSLDVGSTTLNLPIYVTIAWHERAATPLEL
jgi:hypothetical protein